MSSQVWLVRGNCSDYYCGCGGGHVLAISPDEEGAKVLAERATEKHRLGFLAWKKDGPLDYGKFSDVVVVGPFLLGELVDPEFTLTS